MKIEEKIKGKVIEKAREIARYEGYDIRITKQDNESYGFTCDLNFNRINVIVKDNIVIQADIG